eukprot:GFUD01030972.1.p1 GENE.GFUD01030972.1~~GFUD01030972.1.p1  ORF type:complete len:152 (+),score=32.37 GFUD01030972.1:49-456(+)
MAANSTVMYSGFDPNSRNSSKVLREPGGGSADIFGIKEVQEKTPTMSVEESTVAKVASADNEKAEESNQFSSEEVPTNPPTESSTTTPLSDMSAPAPSLAPAPSQAPAPSHAPSPPVAGVRGRIPPGGHSSGSFW